MYKEKTRIFCNSVKSIEIGDWPFLNRILGVLSGGCGKAIVSLKMKHFYQIRGVRETPFVIWTVVCRRLYFGRQAILIRTHGGIRQVFQFVALWGQHLG